MIGARLAKASGDADGIKKTFLEYDDARFMGSSGRLNGKQLP